MLKTSLAKDKIRILLLEGIHHSAVDNFNHQGYQNIQYEKKSLAPKALEQAISQAHFIGIRSRTQLTAEIFKAAKKLIGIGCFCIGTNQVDLKTATAMGVPVFNAPFANTRSVAELVLAEAILLLRRIPEKNALAHRNIWKKEVANAREIRGKTLGIVGYGNIGSQLSVLAEGLGMRVIFYDIISKLPIGNAEQVASLGQLLRDSDVVSLHVPETPQTKLMIDVQQIELMKTGSVLINAARGTVVNLDALATALATDHISGAAIDVFPTEPRSNEDPFNHKLQAFDNVILTPHIGGSTLEAQANIGLEVSEKLITYSDNGSTLASVNFPEAALPKHEKAHRLLHIHHNQPGVMSQINRIFSDNQINICAQYLQTNTQIGYVVVDIEAQWSEWALKQLQQINGTIRCRVLF